MKNNKAPGISQVTIDSIKALPVQLLDKVYNFIVDFCNRKQDYEEWHQTMLKVLPKSGDLSSPNKWRGIAMTDVTAKLNACIINARLQQILEKNGMEEKSGSTKGRGCPDANFTVKKALHSRQMYGQPTWAAFVDLEKA